MDEQRGEEGPEEDPVPHLWKGKQGVENCAGKRLGKIQCNEVWAPMIWMKVKKDHRYKHAQYNTWYIVVLNKF